MTIEWDAYGAGFYEANSGEQTLLVNGQHATDVPFTYINSIAPGSMGAGTSGYWQNFDSTWQHIGPVDITSLVHNGSNTLMFTEVLATEHFSGIANVVVKQNGTIIYGPVQGSPDLSGCGAGVSNGSCSCAGAVGLPCANILNGNNGTLNQSFTFPLNVASAVTITASASPTTVQISQLVSFTGNASGGVPPYSFSWDFGDGATASTQSATHAYAAAGVYTARLSVIDSAGGQGSASVGVTVQGATFTLAVNSTPTGAQFTINGTAATTPFSQILAQGTYTVTMPASITVGGLTYTFSSWENGTTSPQRTVLVNANMTISATYITQQGNTLLTIDSSPSGVNFVLNGGAFTNQNATTPFSQSLPGNTYQVGMPGTVTMAGVLYTFSHWDTGVTTPGITIVLGQAPITVNAVYTSGGGGGGGGGGDNTLLIALGVAGAAAAVGAGAYVLTRKKKGGGKKAPVSQI